jgi:hypothetical protein
VFPTLTGRHGKANQGTSGDTENRTNRRLDCCRASAGGDDIYDLAGTRVPSGQSDGDNGTAVVAA